MLTLAQAFANWKSEIMPAVIAQYGADDHPALSESWNDYTDSLCKDGELSDLQYHHCPAWDDEMPDDDKAFILEQLGISFSSERIAERLDVTDWGAGASHWRVTVKRGGKELVTFYSMGSALSGAPDVADVLECLFSDAESAESARDFWDWAEENGALLGSAEQGRKAERAYKGCKETAEKLADLFSASERTDLAEIFRELEA